MTKEEFKGYVNKGVEASKQAFGKAGKAMSKFGDDSILKIEIQQLKGQIKKDKTALGELAYKAFIEENAEFLTPTEENVAKVLEDIKKALNEIKEREVKLKTEE